MISFERNSEYVSYQNGPSSPMATVQYISALHFMIIEHEMFIRTSNVKGNVRTLLQPCYTIV